MLVQPLLSDNQTLVHDVLNLELDKSMDIASDQKLCVSTGCPLRALGSLWSRNILYPLPLLLEDDVTTLDEDGQEVNPDDENCDRSETIQSPPDDTHLCFLSTFLSRGVIL